MRVSSLAACCALFVACCSAAVAEVKLPCIFGNSMVLQRDQPIRIWGMASPGSDVGVTVGDQKHTGKAGDDGRWTMMLPAMSASGPHRIVITDGSSEVAFEDVMIGEVWLCSGQSNMAMSVNGVREAETEISQADHPAIRMFTIKSSHATEPQLQCEGGWSVCHPNTVSTFSATAYFFGRRLHQELGVPIGLVNSSVGGTSIESWTSMSAQAAVPELEPRLKAWEKANEEYNPENAKENYARQLAAWEKQKLSAEEKGVKVPRRPQPPVQPSRDRNYPSNLFNGKIHPIIGYTIRGAVWYQGENSAGRGFAHLYETQLRTLVTDWRQRWGQGDFPFAWVQLPNFRSPQAKPCETSGWVLVQDGMRKALDIPNSGMAVTIDLGEENDIHPRNKQDVGSRLAQWALASVYGKDLIAMGPVFRSATKEGNRLILTFDHTGTGLRFRGDSPKGFAIAGPDKKFEWANVRIEGDKVIVWHDAISEPASVRYAWASNPQVSLCNSADLPASPFRTDDWEETIAEQ